MNKRWKELDLGGGGLQSANLRLATLLRKRRSAWLLLLLFPLGAHRDYLGDPRGAWLYRAGTALAVAACLLGEVLIGAGLLAALIAGAIYDMSRLEWMIARINKRLRMQVYLRQAPGAPQGFSGRFPDEPQDPEPRDSRTRVPSFAEQERLLRELTRTQPKKGE